MLVCKGKNFGYVKYATSESAKMAATMMHGQTICGTKLKVMLADPPKFDDTKGKRSHSDDRDDHRSKQSRMD